MNKGFALFLAKNKRRMEKTTTERTRGGRPKTTNEERKRGDSCSRRINPMHILSLYS